jgi:hypothetical protein
VLALRSYAAGERSRVMPDLVGNPDQDKNPAAKSAAIEIMLLRLIHLFAMTFQHSAECWNVNWRMLLAGMRVKIRRTGLFGQKKTSGIKGASIKNQRYVYEMDFIEH